MIKALIVDDEPAARQEMRFLLEQTGSVRVVGEATNADEAYELLTKIDYDVIFLDVRMPGLSGTELARKISELQKRPAVVFVSAYSEYAIDAFEVEADDYLVKPVSEERLLKAIEKIQKRKHGGESVKPVQELLSDVFFVDLKDRKIPVRFEDICFFEAVDDYCRLYTAKNSYLINHSLKTLEEKLACRGFLRVHRKYIVNTRKIKEVVQLTRNAYLLKMEDERGTEIPVSRRRVPHFKRVFEI